MFLIVFGKSGSSLTRGRRTHDQEAGMEVPEDCWRSFTRSLNESSLLTTRYTFIPFACAPRPNSLIRLNQCRTRGLFLNRNDSVSANALSTGTG